MNNIPLNIERDIELISYLKSLHGMDGKLIYSFDTEKDTMLEQLWFKNNTTGAVYLLCENYKEALEALPDGDK